MDSARDTDKLTPFRAVTIGYEAEEKDMVWLNEGGTAATRMQGSHLFIIQDRRVLS
jgi:hypothetical protein